MEDTSSSSECVTVTSPQSGTPKSKLDNLSKDDLIKFAKKQIAAIQKSKSKCADLEKEVEALKQQARNSNNSSEDSILIQELTERMDALLLEKAETQQNLVLCRKDLERTKQQAKADVDALRGELDTAIAQHQTHIKNFERAIEQSNSKHLEEVAHLRELLQGWEESARQREAEREQAGAGESVDEMRRSLEAPLESLRCELAAMQERQSKEGAELQEGHQRELTKAQQEVENLREEMAQRALQHEEEMRILEEDCEMERERLLLLNEELTEQLALKDSYLQDVQEEDEEPPRDSGIARMLELSSCGQGDSGEDTESSRLKAALEDLQAQNTMLQDELTLLCNVKAELEAELGRTREDFQTEREELQFKIDELQLSRDSFATDPAVTPGLVTAADAPQANREEASDDGVDPTQDRQELISEEQQRLKQVSQDLQELRAQCEALTGERDSALAEYHHTRDILRGLETELGQKTRDFVSQYEAMKEQGAAAMQDLQDKVKELSAERNQCEQRAGEVAAENNRLAERVLDLERVVEVYLCENRANEEMKVNLQASVEEQTRLASQLKESMEKLTRQNEEILSQLQMKESEAQELQEMVTNLTMDNEQTQSLLQVSQEEVDRLIGERAKEVDALQQDNQKAVEQLREEKERELETLRQERDTEVAHLKEERQRMEDSLKEEAGGRHERVSSLELTMNDLSTDKANLQSKLDQVTAALALVREEKERLGSELTARLEQETSEKQHLEARLIFLKEEAEQAQATITALRESLSEALKGPDEEVLELRARIEEMETERSLLRSCLEEARGERTLEEVREELQARIEDLEKERDMLRRNLEEVVGDTEGLQKDLEAMKVVHEKIRGENRNLLEQISLATQEREEKEAGERENVESERRKLEGQLTEKDSLIAQLRSEMAALQESASPCDLSEENVASQFTEKIALLEKQSREKNEKMNKIKAVAVKAKKELDASKKEVVSLKEEVELLKSDRERISSSMKDIIHGAEGYKNLQIDYDKLTERLDTERENVEAAERQIADLTKRLSAAVTQYEALSSEKEDLLAGMETVRSTLKQLEAQHQELSRHTASLDRDLLTERSVKEHKIRELSSATKEVEELTAQLRKQQQQSQQTAQELEQLRKEAQQSSLMDMEMADYERLVKELNAKLEEREACVENLNAQIHTRTQKVDILQQEIEFMKSQLDQGEEKYSKMKQLLVKTKKDLADSKKHEASQMMLQASLKGELEANQQQLESAKIEVSKLMSERHRLQEQVRCLEEQQQRTSSSLHQRIASLQQECNVAKAELQSTAGEFESYKVRVHNVLKQQKKTSAQSEGDPGKMEREQLCAQVEQLRARLLTSQHSLQSSGEELQQLQAEHDALLERHNKILQETVAKEAELRERVLSVQAENVSLRSEQAQAQAQLRAQGEAQRQAFREQVRRLQDEHRATVETLQGQLARLEEQLFSLQSQSNSVTVTSARKSLTSDPQRRNQEHGQGGQGFLALGDLQSMAREEGEGMETTETERSSPAHTPLPSLEQLLTSPDPKQEPFVWTVEPTKEELSQKLTTVTRSMEHMNSLLHETEATNAVLMEQVNLLKSEVRRLERNQEREKSVANLEYLKNVLLQFIFLRSGSERQALLPVIHTMLQLSPEEKSKLAAIAHGDEEPPGSRGSGWTSYLHSWSGIK